jgi:hypothetical protein
MLEAMAKPLHTWSAIASEEKTFYEQSLVTAMLEQYLEQLSECQVRETAARLLPANFEMYAFCVKAILNEITSLFAQDRQRTVYVTTVLTEPLERWYNISTQTVRGQKCAFTLRQWEDYKSDIAQLKVGQHQQPQHCIQFRRILVPKPREKRLYVYGQGDNVKALTPVVARRVRLPRNFSLLEEIANSRDLLGNQVEMYLIGYFDGENTFTEDWYDLGWHFETAYHDAVLPVAQFADDAKGVYLAYAHNWQSFYSDVFIVDIGRDEGKFGIAFHVDEQRCLSGILVLSDQLIEQLKPKVDELWKAAALKKVGK